jgi:hypothetical protein
LSAESGFKLNNVTNVSMLCSSSTNTPRELFDLTGTFVSGVEMQPEGLFFLQAATLTIRPSMNLSSDHAQGYGYHDSGQNFHLEPLAAGTPLTRQCCKF